VVVDECHLVFMLDDWRLKLALLKNLRLLGCLIVLMTATLPLVWEHTLESSMLVHNATYIRASIVQLNTRYFILWVQRDKMEETAVVVCLQRQAPLQKEGLKGVVYCWSKKQCEKLADALDCCYYHTDAVDRAERLAVWEQEGGLIVATSALGTGVDYLGIVYIVHVGMPWSMINFAQESGRGGRGGEVVDLVILVEHSKVECTLSEKGGDIDVQTMGVFIIGSGCRRLLMSRCLDRTTVSRSGMEALAECDQCGARSGIDLTSRRVVAGSGSRCRSCSTSCRLGAWCAPCSATPTATASGRGTGRCSAPHPRVMGLELDRFHNGIRDQGGIYSCWRCWVIQKYCAARDGWEKWCQWPGQGPPRGWSCGLKDGSING
jgi:hypothetical protein